MNQAVTKAKYNFSFPIGIEIRAKKKSAGIKVP